MNSQRISILLREKELLKKNRESSEKIIVPTKKKTSPSKPKEIISEPEKIIITEPDVTIKEVIPDKKSEVQKPEIVEDQKVQEITQNEEEIFL